MGTLLERLICTPILLLNTIWPDTSPPVVESLVSPMFLTAKGVAAVSPVAALEVDVVLSDS